MTLKYEKTPEFDYNSTLELLDSDKESDLINGLLSIVLNSGDYNLSMEKSIEFAMKESEWIKGCGIECFGHIARLHKKIDLDSIKGIISDGLKSDSKIIVGKSESAVDDITEFLKLDKELFK